MTSKQIEITLASINKKAKKLQSKRIGQYTRMQVRVEMTQQINALIEKTGKRVNQRSDGSYELAEESRFSKEQINKAKLAVWNYNICMKQLKESKNSYNCYDEGSVQSIANAGQTVTEAKNWLLQNKFTVVTSPDGTISVKELN